MSKQSTPITLYKRGNIWWYRFTPPSGARIRCSAQTVEKKKASELAAKHYNECWRSQTLGEAHKTSWVEAVVLWLRDKPERQQQEQYHLRWLHPHLKDKLLSEIDRDVILSLREKRASEGVKNRTVNAVLQQIRGVFRCAYEHGLIDKVPPIKLLQEPKRRIRFLTHEQEARLMNELPEHLKPIVKFALSTGLRMSNITGLRWGQVSLSQRIATIHADEVKTGETIGVPLNTDAVHVITSQVGKHKEFVFTYNGRPIKNAGAKAWREATKRAGLTDFHFHDLRHTWASRHVMSGTSLYVLQELGGWSKADTVKKYAHLTTQHKIDEAERISSVTNLAQSVTRFASVHKNTA